MRKGNLPTHGINQNNFNNTDTLQNFTNAQIYTKGFKYMTAANTVNEFNPLLGGKARKLHGISVYSNINNGFDMDIIDLLLNSEQIIDNVIWWAYNGQGQSGNIFKTEQFFALPRFLSGSDSVQLNWESVNAHEIFIVFYLSDK